MIDAELDDQYQVFNKKRALLASLIQVAQDISGHTHSLNDALLLAKPSQIYPKKVTHYRDQLDRHILALDEPELLKRSNKYDSQTSYLLDALLEFIELTQQQIYDDDEPKEFSEDVRYQLNEFNTVTHTAIGIRIKLQDQGLRLPPVKFGFPQEWLAEQVESLNDTNHALRLKVKDRIAELIYDAEHLLFRVDLSNPMREVLLYVQASMKENLEYLYHGGNIKQLPHEFESLDITTIPQETISEYIDQKNQLEALEKLQLKKPDHEHKMGFNTKMKLWLNTPWKTRWRDIK